MWVGYTRLKIQEQTWINTVWPLPTPQLRSLDHSCLLREAYRDAAILQCLLTSTIFAEAHLNVGTLLLIWFVQPSNKSLAQIQLIIIGSDVVIFFQMRKWSCLRSKSRLSFYSIDQAAPSFWDYRKVVLLDQMPVCLVGLELTISKMIMWNIPSLLLIVSHN